MNKDELIKSLAELICGLEAPYSLNPRLLGVGGKAWLAVYDGLDLLGWASKEEIEAALAEALCADCHEGKCEHIPAPADKILEIMD